MAIASGLLPLFISAGTFIPDNQGLNLYTNSAASGSTGQVDFLNLFISSESGINVNMPLFINSPTSEIKFATIPLYIAGAENNSYLNLFINSEQQSGVLKLYIRGKTLSPTDYPYPSDAIVYTDAATIPLYIHNQIEDNTLTLFVQSTLDSGTLPLFINSNLLGSGICQLQSPFARGHDLIGFKLFISGF